MLPELSIVICTHRRFELLEGAVASLADQEPVESAFEVLVVDNDTQPNARVQAVVERYQPMLDIRYLHEGRLGLSHARNTGGQAARAEYVAYIDDDARADANYVAAAVDVIRAIAPRMCGGPYYPFYLDSKPAWFKDEYGMSSLGDRARWLNAREYLTGGNFIVTRTFLDACQWFDPSLGMSGKRVWYGEETKVQMDAHEMYGGDARIYYDPRIAVQHLVPLRKMSVAWRLRSAFQSGGSQAYFWGPAAPPSAIRSMYGALRTLLVLVLRDSFRLWLRDRTAYPHWQNYAYERVAKQCRVLGAQLRYTTDSWKRAAPFFAREGHPR